MSCAAIKIFTRKPALYKLQLIEVIDFLNSFGPARYYNACPHIVSPVSRVYAG